MPNFPNDPVVASSDTQVALVGTSQTNEGVRGNAHGSHGGVVGVNDWAGNGTPGSGGNGGWFESAQGEGLRGTAKNPNHGGVVGVNTAGGIAVYGTSDAGIAVMGESKGNEGVRGSSHSAHGGVVGVNDWAGDGTPGSGGNGGWFESTRGEGVRGWSKNPDHGGVVGINTGGGIAVYGEGPVAGFFKGDVVVTGDIRLDNADCAENFDIAGTASVEPGTVMVLGFDSALMPSSQAYDRRVVGVVSGAGSYRPGMVLDAGQQGHRLPIALMGKVFCKAEAPIAIGDMLTTSSRAGHAMKAQDHGQAFGAVIGKALGALDQGTGLVPVLVALQ